MQFFLPFPTIHQQKPSSSPTAEQVRHLNKCQAWTTAWVNAGCVMIKDATGEMCSAAPGSSGVQIPSLRCAAEPKDPALSVPAGPETAATPPWHQGGYRFQNVEDCKRLF